MRHLYYFSSILAVLILFSITGYLVWNNIKSEPKNQTDAIIQGVSDAKDVRSNFLNDVKTQPQSQEKCTLDNLDDLNYKPELVKDILGESYMYVDGTSGLSFVGDNFKIDTQNGFLGIMYFADHENQFSSRIELYKVSDLCKKEMKMHVDNQKYSVWVDNIITSRATNSKVKDEVLVQDAQLFMERMFNIDGTDYKYENRDILFLNYDESLSFIGDIINIKTKNGIYSYGSFVFSNGQYYGMTTLVYPTSRLKEMNEKSDYDYMRKTMNVLRFTK